MKISKGGRWGNGVSFILGLHFHPAPSFLPIALSPPLPPPLTQSPLASLPIPSPPPFTPPSHSTTSTQHTCSSPYQSSWSSPKAHCSTSANVHAPLFRWIERFCRYGTSPCRREQRAGRGFCGVSAIRLCGRGGGRINWVFFNGHEFNLPKVDVTL